MDDLITLWFWVLTLKHDPRLHYCGLFLILITVSLGCETRPCWNVTYALYYNTSQIRNIFYFYFQFQRDRWPFNTCSKQGKQTSIVWHYYCPSTDNEFEFSGWSKLLWRWPTGALGNATLAKASIEQETEKIILPLHRWSKRKLSRVISNKEQCEVTCIIPPEVRRRKELLISKCNNILCIYLIKIVSSW